MEASAGCGFVAAATSLISLYSSADVSNGISGSLAALRLLSWAVLWLLLLVACLLVSRESGFAEEVVESTW